MSLRSFILDHPRPLVWAWEAGSWVFRQLGPTLEKVGVEKASKFIHPLEWVFKVAVFDCHSCGQCILHYTGMTCPMTCPKQLRNGPCGGVRPDGHCEVYPDRDCVWVKGLERIERTPYAAEKLRLNMPVDWRLEDLSSYVTYATGADQITTGNQGEVRYATEVLASAAEAPEEVQS